MSELINTKNAPKAIGPYSQAVCAGNMIFTSGQISLEPETGEVIGESIDEQTHRVCKNLRAVLSAAGGGLENVVKTSCYLSDMKNFERFNKVYGEYFTGKPARSCIEVSRLPKDVLVEIDVVAERRDC